jgi:hypothetical protein
LSDVLIDLGELPQGGKQGVRAAVSWSPHRFRNVLGVVAVLLLALLSGAAHQPDPVAPTIISARLGDNMYVAGDRLFVVSAGSELLASPVQNKIISTYALPAGNLLSLTTVAVPGAIFDVTQAGQTVLVSFQADTEGAEATVALAAGTNHALWRVPSRMFGVSAARGMVILRENSPEFGDLHWYGVDLTSGAVRWSLVQPARGYITATDYRDGFPRRLIVANDGALEVRDAETGAVTARSTYPAPSAGSNPELNVWTAGDLVLVGDGTAGTIAYGLDDLTVRWRNPVDLSQYWIQTDCGTIICAFHQRRGMLALEPATGRTLWSAARWSYADLVGSYLVAADTDSDGDGADADLRLSVLDPATGRVRGDFGDWQTAGTARPDGTVIGMRAETTLDVVWYARLNPADHGVQVLGAAEKVSGDCQTTLDVLVCRRVDASVGVWRLTGND